MEEIITRCIFPPIPIRDFDWIAMRKDCDEDSIIGYGKTEKEAIDDLLLQEEYLK